MYNIQIILHWTPNYTSHWTGLCSLNYTHPVKSSCFLWFSFNYWGRMYKDAWLISNWAMWSWSVMPLPVAFLWAAYQVSASPADLPLAPVLHFLSKDSNHPTLSGSSHFKFSFPLYQMFLCLLCSISCQSPCLYKLQEKQLWFLLHLCL